MRDVVDDIKEAFLTGVSYMLPFVVAGGILVALGFLLGGYDIPNTVEPEGILHQPFSGLVRLVWELSWCRS